MAFAQRMAITAFRNDPLCETFYVVGWDFTGADVAFAVRQQPDQAGAALIEATGTALAVDTTPNAGPSIRLVEVTEDVDGVKTSVLELRDTKAHMQALPAAAEQGSDLTLYFDLQWTLAAAELDPLASDEATQVFGDFIVKGSANG